MPVTNPSPDEIYTVSRLNREVHTVLKDGFPTLWVEGEISSLARPVSGHLYFTLKDAAAQVRCALFRNRRSGLRFEPEDGLQVLARANIGLYEGRGEYQLVIDSLQAAGAGDLRLAFEALKQKLATEGLFDNRHKKPLPPFPNTIGVLTSTSGAAIRDILSVLRRRYPYGGVIVYPTLVQGAGAADKIADAIKRADRQKKCDVLILGRGGGSPEDMQPFNEETVARAIFGCKTPLISGIGHEIDFTIADFVADERAPTPSIAAELVSPDSDELVAQLRDYAGRMERLQRQRIKQQHQHIALLSRRLPHPARYLRQRMQKVDEYSLRLGHRIEQKITRSKIALGKQVAAIERQNPSRRIIDQRQRLNTVWQWLHQAMLAIVEDAKRRVVLQRQILQTVGPVATLERGYAVVTETRSGNIVKDAREMKTGDRLNIRLAKGEIRSTVDRIRKV